MHQSGFTFGDLLALFYGGASTNQDIYQPVITFLVSRITDSSSVLFATFGVLLGYVYSRSIWFLIDRYPGRFSVPAIILLFAFAMDLSIGVSLNGVRMWTALHVFIFGFLYYFGTGKRRYLLIALLTPLIHFSYLLPCAFLALFLFVRHYGTAIYAFFASSFFFANLEIGVVRSLLSYLPLTFEEHATTSYVDRADASAAVATESAGKVWFLVLNQNLVALFVFLAATFLFTRGVHKGNRIATMALLFGMLFYGFTNLISYIPSAARFYNVGEMLIIAAILLYLGDQSRLRKIDRQVSNALAPLLSINIALGIRFSLDYASIYLLAGNFFLIPFVSPAQSLYELIESTL